MTLRGQVLCVCLAITGLDDLGSLKETFSETKYRAILTDIIITDSP
jgi:hypothetical protein